MRRDPPGTWSRPRARDSARQASRLFLSVEISVGTQTHAAGNRVALDLARASGDGGDDALAPAEAHHAFGRKSVTGEDLHSPAGGFDVGLGSFELGHRP